jgi:hypothetical protein
LFANGRKDYTPEWGEIVPEKAPLPSRPAS